MTSCQPKPCARCGRMKIPGPKEFPKRWNARPLCKGCAHIQGVEVRFWPKVNKTEGCWLWTGARNDKGYGQLFKSKRSGRGEKYCAHRLAYELLVGPIPDEMELDHLCRTPACVNPKHLEPVTHSVNLSRQPRQVICKRGHILERRPRGKQQFCRTCTNEWSRRYLREKRANMRAVS